MEDQAHVGECSTLLLGYMGPWGRGGGGLISLPRCHSMAALTLGLKLKFLTRNPDYGSKNRRFRNSTDESSAKNLT